MIANRIPGGLLEGTTEFFTISKPETQVEPMCIYNGILYDFSGTPDCRKEILRKRMKSEPRVEHAMEVMVGPDEERKLAKFTACRYGAMNSDADIDANGNLSEPEYVPCGERDTCKFQGTGCVSIMVREGVFLSKAQTAVFIRVKLPDKNIADELFLSVETVKAHWKAIRKATGLNNKIEIAIWATQKGII
ncbi:MAG TPA: hypothetical protein VGE26_09115 [Sphingobacteriaceae bacterium]